MTDTYILRLIEKGESLFSSISFHEVQDTYDWIFEVEKCLESNGLLTGEFDKYLKSAKQHGNNLNDCNKLISLLKTKMDVITVPPIKKRNQVFVAMWFSDKTDHYYDGVYKPVINSLNLSAFRIDKKEFNGPITSEILNEISDSIALIADLTGNRGGVYYESGIAKGLSLCNHPIQLIFTCSHEYFSNPDFKPHFDVSVENTIVYKDESDLASKLKKRLEQTVLGVNNE